MLDRLHAYATKRKAPGWVLILLVAGIVIYEIIDVISNIDFVAENAGYVSWVRDYGVSPLGLLLLMLAGFAWLVFVPEPKRSAVPSDSAVLSSEAVTVPTAAQSKLFADGIELSMEYTYNSWHYTDGLHKCFAYVRVKNTGAPDTFMAQVVDLFTDDPTPQYVAKWKGSNSPDRLIYVDDLLTLAEVVDPADKWDIDEADGSQKHAGFAPGYFRLFSSDMPDGWVVESSNWPSGPKGTVPPEKRHLLIFNTGLTLDLRVAGTRGQRTSAQIHLSFREPDYDYDNEKFIHIRPDASIRILERISGSGAIWRDKDWESD